MTDGTQTGDESPDVVEQTITAPKQEIVPAARSPKEPSVPMTAGGAVRPIIPHNLAEVAKLALVVHESGLAPYGLKTVQQVAVAMMYGAEIGLPPMQAIQSIAVINGRPSIYGDAGIALVRNSGLLARFKEWFTGEPYEDSFTAHCLVQRMGEDEVEEIYSVADAKRAKLWEKKTRDGGDTPWVTHPKRMLKWRARNVFRDVFADALRGLRFTEEVRDDEPLINELPPPTIASRLPGPSEPVHDVEGAMNGTADPDAEMLVELTTALNEATIQTEIDVIAEEFAAAIEHASGGESIAAGASKLIADRRMAIGDKKRGKKDADKLATLV